MSQFQGSQSRLVPYLRKIQNLSNFGMLGVLIGLCLFFSFATYQSAVPTGSEGGTALAEEIGRRGIALDSPIIIVSQTDETEKAFADALQERLKAKGYQQTITMAGDPPSVRTALEELATKGTSIRYIATTKACGSWTIFERLKSQTPAFAQIETIIPSDQKRSTFLSPSNLSNIADQISVIAIMAIGMTFVILTGGVDLSVGSLVALSAVLTAWLIRLWGGTNASFGVLLTASLVGIAVCGLVGVFSGSMIALFKVPSFIATLSVMLVASGFAYMVSQGHSIYDIPASYIWLGRGADLFSLPNAVVLMILLYLVAFVILSKTRFGRAVYAVGGNPEAARLSGIATGRTLLLVYTISGLLAGLGGIITASQLKAGVPTYGTSYELYVIAAVVVGGTSLTGGKGRILDTLIGAFIIAVIRNGMNLMNIEPYTQKVVLGFVILGAVLIDLLKRRRNNTDKTTASN